MPAPSSVLFNGVATGSHIRRPGRLHQWHDGVACHDHGTTPRVAATSMDHPVASDGTTPRVAPWGLIISDVESVDVMRRGGSVDGVREVSVVEVREVLRGGWAVPGCVRSPGRRG
jgi:hypothetical protein